MASCEVISFLESPVKIMAPNDPEIKFEDGYDQKIDGYVLTRTCFACPEQYDVYKDNQCVGYLRLRHGHFRAHLHDCSGPLVYESWPQSDGIFEDTERTAELSNAVAAINKALQKEHAAS
jgi:hypothetical protein